MEWTKGYAEDEVFWHVTGRENRVGIESKGIIESKNGQQGKGTYALFADEDVLDSIMELMEQEDALDSTELLEQEDGIRERILVEFRYTGEYEYCPVDMLVYASEGWVVIRQNIDVEDIKKIREI